MRLLGVITTTASEVHARASLQSKAHADLAWWWCVHLH